MQYWPVASSILLNSSIVFICVVHLPVVSLPSVVGVALKVPSAGVFFDYLLGVLLAGVILGIIGAAVSTSGAASGVSSRSSSRAINFFAIAACVGGLPVLLLGFFRGLPLRSSCFRIYPSADERSILMLSLYRSRSFLASSFCPLSSLWRLS